MSLQLNDRVKETSTTTGTVPIVLNGASIGYQSISSAISSGNSFPYVIELTGGSQWEIGIGTYVSGNNSIIRTQVLNSSDSGNKVDFISGSKNVFITVPAAYTALTAKGLSQFSATSSAELASIISDETGSGKLVFSNNAILVAPDIGRANGTSLTLSGDLSVTGNVYLSGNVTTLSSNNLSINDSLIYLAQDNPANLQDIGVVGHFTTDHYQHTGLVRDATDGVWKLFSNISTEPSTTIDFSGGVIYDTFQAGTILSSNAVFSVANGSQPFTVVSNTLVSNLNADLLDGQHGTYYAGLSGSAFGQANAAYTQANTGVIIGQAAFIQANAAYSQANSGVTIGLGAISQANSAFTQANTGIVVGQGAFTQANTAYTAANTGIAVGQGSFTQANAAYTAANTGISVGQASFGQANSGFTQANAAYTQANTAVTIGQGAFTQANTGVAIGQGAFGQANSGFTQANAAYTQANTGVIIGQASFGQANAAYTQANTGIAIGQAAFIQANAAYNTANTKFSANGGTISGSVTITNDLNVSGNVYLSGNVTTVSSNNLIVNDPIIYLANNNVGNSQDIGFVGHFTGSSYQHTGLVRRASDGVWRLFSNVSTEPTSTVDFTNVIYDPLQVGSITTSNATFSVATGTAPFTVVSNTVIVNLNADYLDGQHGTYYTGLTGIAFDQANSAYVQANTGISVGQAAFTQANAAYGQANNGLTLAQSKVTSFYQSTSPATSNTKDTWIHSDTGVKYENVGNTSNPVWIECGPTGVAGNSTPGIVSGTSVLSSNGVYSTGTYTGSYTDGTVLDYVNGNGRISVGVNDGIKFYNGGVGANTLLTISPAGQVYSNYTGANAGATLMLSGNNTIGGSGYFDFLKVTNNAPGATNPSKTIRLNVTGGLEIIDNAYGNTLFLMDNSGQIITNGYGLLTTNRPAFRVIGSGGSISSTTTMTSSNWTVDFNQGNYLNSSTGIFTAPVQGLYQVNVVVRTNSNSYNGISQIIIQKTAYSGGATSTQIMVEFGNNTSMNHAGGSAIVKMAVGDTLKFIVSAGTISFDGNDNWSVAYIG